MTRLSRLADPRRAPVTASARIGAALLAGLITMLLSTTARAADDWLGPDKAVHFGVSAGLGLGGYAAASPFLEGVPARAIAGSSFSLSLGVAKELYDLSGHGDASWRDLTWDVVGTAVGVGLAVLFDVTLFPDDEHEQGTAPGAATAAIRF
jgi:putative lipoprotein